MFKIVEIIIKLADKLSILEYFQLLLLETHFKLYLNDIENIVTKTSISKTIFRKLKIIFLILGQQCFHLAFLVCYPQQNPTWRLLLYDSMFFLKFPAQLNLCLLQMFLQATAFFYLSYYPFRNSFKRAHFIIIVKNVVYQDDKQYFLWPTIELTIFGKRKAFSVTKVVRQITQHFILNCYYFFLFFTIYSASFHLISVKIILKNVHFATPFANKLFHLAIYLLNCLLFDMAVAILVIIQTTVPTVIVAISTIFFVRLRQIEQQLTGEIKKNKAVKIHQFARNHNDTFVTMMAVNGYFGRLLFIYILLIIPMNVYSSMLLLSGQLGSTAFSNAFFIVLNLAEGTGFICFHYLAAWYTKILHKSCSRHLPSLMAKMARKSYLSAPAIVNGRDQRLLHDYIVKFALSKRRYGITYSNFGLVSFFTFTKFVLFTSEFEMYCYKQIISKNV